MASSNTVVTTRMEQLPAISETESQIGDSMA